MVHLEIEPLCTVEVIKRFHGVMVGDRMTVLVVNPSPADQSASILNVEVAAGVYAIVPASM